jgi:hypothetical protein
MLLFATTSTCDANGDALGVGVALGLGVGVGLGVAVGVALGRGVGLGVGEALCDGVGDAVGDAVGADVGLPRPGSVGVELPPPPQPASEKASAAVDAIQRADLKRILLCVGSATRFLESEARFERRRLRRARRWGSIQCAEDAGPSRRASVEERPGSIGQGAG